MHTANLTTFSTDRASLMQLKIKKSHEGVPTPFYATAGAMAFDAVAWLGDDATESDSITLAPAGGSHMFDTGISVEVPPGYCLVMNVRSGLGGKDKVQLSNNQGWIDSDYRGKVMASLINLHPTQPRVIRHKERIVQCAILPAPQVEIVVVDELSSTVRGEGGFGSTGS